MVAVIRGVLRSDTLWRYVDVFSPRVFALLFHSFIFSRYGASSYAFPAWILGIFTLTVGFIPDPHAFILARRYGPAAQRLFSLAIPWVWLKLGLAVILSLALIVASPSELGRALGAGNRFFLASAVCIYGSIDVMWSIAGTVRLATGDLKSFATAGVLARVVSISIVIVASLAWSIDLKWVFLLASFPVLTALLPYFYRWGRFSRSVAFGCFAFKHYAIWAQGVAFVTALLSQAPIVLFGITGNLSPAQIGQASFFLRIAMALMQPSQVLQSLVIAESTRLRGEINAKLLRLRNVFRAYGVLFFAGTTAFGAYAVMKPYTDYEVAKLCAVLAVGLGVSIWYRFELSRLLATTRVRALLVIGYLPVIAACTLFGAIGYFAFQDLAIAIAVSGAWIGLSSSWRWVKLRPRSDNA